MLAVHGAQPIARAAGERANEMTAGDEDLLVRERDGFAVVEGRDRCPERGNAGGRDEDKIPTGLRGYVAVALERGFIDTFSTSSGLKFDPDGSIPRLNAAGFLLRVLDRP